MNNAIVNSEYANTEGASSSVSLSLNVNTTEATSSSVTLEIGLDSIVTTTIDANVHTEITPVKALEKYVTVTVQMQSRLSNVAIKHTIKDENGNDVVKNMVSVNSSPIDELNDEQLSQLDTNGAGVFFYNINSGLLTIKTKSFSPFEVSYTPVKFIALKDGEKYSSLTDAVNSITDSTETTIILITDASGNGVKVPSGRNIIFDLNGHVYNIDGTTVGSSGTETNGFQLLKDSTIVFKNGTITSDKAKILIQNYSNLTLDNIVLDGSKLVDTKSYTLSNNNGTIIINNSTIIADENGVAFDVYSFDPYTGTNVTVKGNSIIDGKIEIGRTNDASLALTIEEGSLYGQIVVSEELNNCSLNCQDPSIATTSQLVAFEKMVNQRGYGYSGKTVKLLADIDLQGIEWKPVGQTGGYTAKTYFQGTFDGNGKTISNLNILESTWEAGSNEGKHYATGFFGFIDAGGNTIKNVKFENANVVGHHWVGVAVGYMTGTVSGVTVTDSTITSTYKNGEADGDKAGGVVGYLNSGSITGCTVTGSTISAVRDCGSVAGYSTANGSITGNTAENCTVYYSTDNNEQIGGEIAGKRSQGVLDHNTASNVTIIKLVSTDEKLSEILDSTNPGETIIVNLTSGNFSLPSGSCIDKNVKIVGSSENTILNILPNNATAYQNGAYLEFENLTIQGQTSGNYGGLAHTKEVTYKNCRIVGKITLYANTETFIDCTLENSNDYSFIM